MQNTKKYWLRGLIIGILLGALITYAHENLYELAHALNIDPHTTNTETTNQFDYKFLQIYGRGVNIFWDIGLTPWFFLGALGLMELQYVLPSLTFGIIGLLLGWLYRKIKNRKQNPVPTASQNGVL